MKGKTLASLLLAGLASVEQTASAQDWQTRRVMGSINWPTPNMSLYGDKLYYANIQGFPAPGGGPPNENHPWAWEQIWEQDLVTDNRRLIRSIDFGAGGREITPSVRNQSIVFSYANGGGLGQMNINTGEISNLPFGNGGYRPAIDESKVVWSGPSVENSFYFSIQLKDMSSGQQSQLVSNTNKTQDYPSIHNNKIVWQENSATDPTWGIKLFDLMTGQQTNIPKRVGDESIDYTRPNLFGNEIVFERAGDIWLYNLVNNQFSQISATPFYEATPTIWGDRIAWSQYGPDQGDFSEHYWNYYVADRIPAPATLGLLGIAGLATSRRKRE